MIIIIWYKDYHALMYPQSGTGSYTLRHYEPVHWQFVFSSSQAMNFQGLIDGVSGVVLAYT